MYRPPEDIRELRAKGLPWVVATCLVVMFVLFALLFYYVTAENWAEGLATTPAVAFLNYQIDSSETEESSMEHIEYDIQSSATTISPTTDPSLEWQQPPRGNSRTFLHAAVSCRNEYCAEIGRNVLIRGGNAVDAAIATVICVGSLHPHATGFGGGMVMLLHDREKNETVVLSSYSAAPRTATEETFLVNPTLAEIGYSSIATPGFLHGIWTAFKRYGSGRVAWQDLLLHSVLLLERGVPASSDFVEAVQRRVNEIASEKSMSAAYNVTLSEGQLFQDFIHAAFLRRLAIARDPVELFYRGEIANQIVHEMKQYGGLLTKIDLASYETNIEKPLEIPLPYGFTLKGPHPPSSFAALSLMVEIVMSHYEKQSRISPDSAYFKELLTAQRVALATLEQMGDPDYTLNDPIIDILQVPQSNITNIKDEQTSNDVRNLLWDVKHQSYVGSHINVIDKRNQAVSLSSSLNDRFGSVRRSLKGGFVWNNEMSAFTIRDKQDSEDMHVNAIEGRKRPRSSMSPFMVFDQHGQLIASVGITGSLNSILAAAQVILNHILLKKDHVSSVSSPRVFAILEGATFELELPMMLLSELRNEVSMTPLLSYDSTVHFMRFHSNGSIECICDFRDLSDQCARGF